jgi:endoglycosylceramidase
MSTKEIAFLFLFIWLGILFKTSLSFADINIDKNSRQFVDKEGRVRIFHGVNIVVKNPPYTPLEGSFDPINSLSDIDYDYLTKFGFNVVRLGVIWEAVETQPGIYNSTYLDIYEKIINKLGERGIYTILDSHQDMFSRVLCGEGVPVFYAKDLIWRTQCNEGFLEKLLDYFGVCMTLISRNIPSDENGIPLTEECKKHSFIEFHQVIELSSIYKSFFENLNNIQDKFIDYWKILAKKFKGNKYILGYDIWNEPWVGDLFTDYKNFIPGYYTNNNFLPFYAKIDKELRKIDDEFVVMFEEALFPDTLPLLGGFYLGGFKTTPAGEKYLNRQIWSKHWYCKGLNVEMGKYKDIPVHLASTDCRNFAEYSVRKAKEKSDELGVPLFLTEFGACPEGMSCYHEITGLADVSDRHLLSWAYWMYKPYGDHTTHCDGDTEGLWNPDGSLQELKLKSLTRPYIMAFQGTPIKSYYYTELNILHAKFVLNTDIDEYSILYINSELFYKNGFKVLFVSHEVNTHLHKTELLLKKYNKISDIDNRHDNSKIIDIYQYLKFKIEPAISKNKNSPSDKKNNLNIFHEYLGFRGILENTVEVLLCEKIKYNIISENKELIKLLGINRIVINTTDLNHETLILNTGMADNLVLVENKNVNLKEQEFQVLIDYKNTSLEDIDHLENIVELIKSIKINSEYLINQVYIPKSTISIFYENSLIYEISFISILNNFILIRME